VTVLRFIHSLAGPRFIDPYLRVLMLGFGLYLCALQLPSFWWDLSSSLSLLVGLAVCLSPYAPLTTGLAMVLLSGIVTVLYEPGMVMFDIPIAAACVVLVSHLRWKSVAVLLLSLLGLAIMTHLRSPLDFGWSEAGSLGVTVGLLCLLGVGAAKAEGRIQFLIAKSAAEAVAGGTRNGSISGSASPSTPTTPCPTG
jgi:hypothetical protein